MQRADSQPVPAPVGTGFAQRHPDLEEYPQHKVFCIGLNKTGTTSMGAALAVLGYRRCGWQGPLSSRLTRAFFNGRIKPLVRTAHEYDGFEDFPWFLVYKEMAKVFPNAKFVLTVRRDEATWLRSITAHGERKGPLEIHRLTYGHALPSEDQNSYLAKYRSHNEDVRSFFAGQPERLLEMCFETGAGWPELCGFLGMHRLPPVPFPHVNQRISRTAPAAENAQAA